MSLAEELKRHADELVAAASETPFIVFLCGPKLTANTASARFRARIKERLEQEKFEVILGEDVRWTPNVRQPEPRLKVSPYRFRCRARSQ